MKVLLVLFILLQKSFATSENKPLTCLNQSAACANVNAGSVTLAMDIKAVNSMLPDSLQLVPQPKFSKQGLHPVVFLFGQHSQYSISFTGKDHMLKNNYNEFILVVPFVREKNKSLVYWYFPKLYLNQDFPIQAGKPYGFNKFYEEIDVQFNNGHLSQMRVGNKIDIRLEKDGSIFQMLTHGGSAIATQMKIIHLPVIGFLPNGQKRCSQFYWSYLRSMLTPARVKISVTDQALPGISARTFDIRGIGATPEMNTLGGAFMKSRWHISLPKICD